MRKLFSFTTSIILSFVLLLSAGCVKDTCQKAYTYTFYQPVYRTAAEVRTNIRSNAVKEIERPGKIYMFGNYIFLNELDKGIHVIDNSKPSSPQRVAFIDIPGNVDLAVKGNTLYADLYTDLVAIDISNPKAATVKKIVEGVFPHRVYYTGFHNDSSKIIVDWVKRDTTVMVNCEEPTWLFESINSRGMFFDMAAANMSSSKATSSSPVGVGGSMARFALVNERMYTVGENDLNVFDISNATNPTFTNKKNLNWGIETIFPFKDKLFIGSTTGMFVYNISNPDNPTQAGQFTHAVSCDPVIADDDYAFVTLRTGNRCNGISNQMDVLKLNNITDPTLVKTYPFSNPHGLSKDGNILFVCDGTDGLKVYNAKNVNSLLPITHIKGLQTYDVIAYNNIALVVAKDGLYQYDYSNVNDIRLLSKISLTR